MESTRITISGIDTQVDEYSPRDGACSQLDKFRPTGRIEDPKWRVITDPTEYNLNFGSIDEEDIDRIIAVFYAINNFYCIIQVQGIVYLYRCTFNSGVITLSSQFFAIEDTTATEGSSIIIDDTTSVSIQEFGENVFYLLISNDSIFSQHQLWEVTSSGAVPAIFRPELHLVQVTINDQSLTTSNFDVLYPVERQSNKISLGTKLNIAGDLGSLFSIGNSHFTLKNRLIGLNAPSRTIDDIVSPASGDIVRGGTYPGILKDKDKYFGIITAFRHPNGTWFKHSSPYVMEIEGQTSSIGTNTEFSTLSFGKNPDYTDDSNNYADNVEDDFNTFFHTTSSLTWKELGEVGIFMTVAKNTLEEAYLEGTYFLLGVLDDDDELNWNANEETIPTGEVLNIDPFSHHVITGKAISSYRNNLALIRPVTHFILPGWDWNSFNKVGGVNINPKIGEDVSGGTLAGETPLSNEECVLIVYIETDSGEISKNNTMPILYIPGTSTDYILYFSNFHSYPDRQATRLQFFWFESGSGYNLVRDVNLKPHPFLNISYYLNSDQPFETLAFTPSPPYPNLGALFFSDNSKILVEENEFKISDISKLYFPLDWSYQVQDKVSALVDNTNETSQGQFGEYPLYILGENSILGAKSGEGILIAKMDEISRKHGVNGFESHEVYRNTLFFVSNHGIHALSGTRIEDIYNPVEGIGVDFISSDVSTRNPTFNTLLNNGRSELFSNVLSSVKVGIHPATHEIVFSTNGGLLIFNEKYRQWYTFTINGEGNPASPYDFASYDFLFYKDEGLHFLEVPFDIGNSSVIPWGIEGTQSGFFSLVTSPIVFNDYGMFKRIKRMVLQGDFIINATGTDPDSGLYSLNVVLQGRRSTEDDWLTLITITDDSVKTVKSKYLKTNRGSFQAYRVLVYGENLAANSFVSDILSTYENRGRFTK